MEKSNYKQMHSILLDSLSLRQPAQHTQSPVYRNWRKAVGNPIAENTSNLKIEGNILHVVVNSPTWAHELINQQASILEALRAEGHLKLTEMSIRIQVPVSKPTPVSPTMPKRERRITPGLRNLFAQLSSESRNPEVKQIFRRLSRKSDD